MLYIMLLIPLLNFIYLFIFGRFLGIDSIKIAIINKFILLCMLFFFFFEVCNRNYISTVYLMKWINNNLLNIEFSFLVDTIAIILLFIVIFISFFVNVFAYNYMWNDPYIVRFFAYLNIFTLFMLLLVVSGNFLQFFLAWEGVGLASFLLISFWNTRKLAIISGLKAIFLNRIGDLSLLFGILLIIFFFNNTDFIIYDSIFKYDCNFFLINVIDVIIIKFSFFKIMDIIYFINICFIIAAIAKSAQIILHVWLPDAMEGPTPVSALLHAATMVTAGIFLLIRSYSFIIESYEYIQYIIITLALITCIFSSTSGALQYDLKRIIAFSTCSQISYMFFACGLLHFSFSFFHLMMHAFFKAALFISAGVIIHALSDEQDLRYMGGVDRLLSWTSSSFLVANFSLLGVPFMTGFFSKDLIIEASIIYFNINFYVLGDIFLVCSILSVLYSLRAFYVVFIYDLKIINKCLYMIYEDDWFSLVSLFILVLFSIFGGYFFFNLVVSYSFICFFFSLDMLSYIELLNNNEEHFLEFRFKILTSLILFCSFIIISFYFKIFIRNFYINNELNTNKSIFYNSFYSLDLLIYNYNENINNDICINYFKYIQIFSYFKFYEEVYNDFYFFFFNILKKKWNFDYFNYYSLKFFFNKLSYNYFILIDYGILENLGPYYIVKFLKKLIKFQKMQDIILDLLFFIILIIFSYGISLFILIL